MFSIRSFTGRRPSSLRDGKSFSLSRSFLFLSWCVNRPTSMFTSFGGDVKDYPGPGNAARSLEVQYGDNQPELTAWLASFLQDNEGGWKAFYSVADVHAYHLTRQDLYTAKSGTEKHPFRFPVTLYLGRFHIQKYEEALAATKGRDEYLSSARSLRLRRAALTRFNVCQRSPHSSASSYSPCC